MTRLRFEIRSAWDGSPLRADEWASLDLEIGPNEVVARIEAAFHDDPVPPSSPGRTDGLWEFEVVELFLLGHDGRYLELEFGPHGHWLGLFLSGRRQIENDQVSLSFRTKPRVANTSVAWSGEARIPRSALPARIDAANFYAIHGEGRDRRHLAMHPVPGDAPDFHRLDRFGRLDES